MMSAFCRDLGLVTLGSDEAWATFSPCEKYRYALSRVWNDHGAILVAILHNPSKARHDLSDPTLEKVCKFARRDKFGGVIIGNPFAYRATDPRELLEARLRGEDIVGPHNIEVVRRLIDGPILAKAVAGWGPPKWKALRAGINSMHTLGTGRPWWCWNTTKTGYPGHPLYLRDDSPLKLYEGRYSYARMP